MGWLICLTENVIARFVDIESKTIFKAHWA